MPEQTYVTHIAHIRDGDKVFQVLNQEGTDWDEEATKAAYAEYLASKPTGFFSKLFG